MPEATQPVSNVCSIDGRPTDRKLCRGCLDVFTTELRAIPWLVEQLTITLTRQARVGARNGPRGAEKPLVFHLGASVDLETLRDGLGLWCAAVAKQRGIVVDAAQDPVALSKWLLRWSGEVAQHEDAGELHGDIMAMTKAARRTIDLAPELRYVGPCDGHRAIVADTIGCKADLYASMNSFTVHCGTDGCDAEYQIETRRAWLLEQAVDQLRTAAQLSRELPWIAGVVINRKLINQWASRGVGGLKLTPFLPHAKDAKQATRYRLGEVIEFARATAEHAAKKVAS